MTAPPIHLHDGQGLRHPPNLPTADTVYEQLPDASSLPLPDTVSISSDGLHSGGYSVSELASNDAVAAHREGLYQKLEGSSSSSSLELEFSSDEDDNTLEREADVDSDVEGGRSQASAPLPAPRLPARSTDDDLEDAEQAHRELEDLEIHAFLLRAGQQVKAVALPEGAEDQTYKQFPGWREYIHAREVGGDAKGLREDWQRVDWFSFLTACLFITFDNFLPPDFFQPSTSPPLKLSICRQHLSRVYVSVPQGLIDAILGGAIGRLYRWEDATFTAKCAALYAFLWLADLIPAFICLVPAYLLLKARAAPQDASLMAAEIQQRAQREQEAKRFGKEAKMGFVARSLGMNSQLANLVGSAATGPASLRPGDRGGAVPRAREMYSKLSQFARRSGEQSTSAPMSDRQPTQTSFLAQSLLGTAHAAAFVGGVGVTTAATSNDTSSTRPSTSASRRDATDRSEPPPALHGGPISLYKLTTELSKRFGPEAQMYLGDAADISEKLRNLFLWRKPLASYATIGMLCASALYLATVPVWILVKSFFLWIGVYFFVFLALQDKYPKYRRCFNPIWYYLYAVPTDAQHVMNLLQERAAEGRPIRSSKSIKQIGRNQQRRRPRELATTAPPLWPRPSAESGISRRRVVGGHSRDNSFENERPGATSNSREQHYASHLSTDRLPSLERSEERPSITDRPSYKATSTHGSIESTRSSSPFMALRSSSRLRLPLLDAPSSSSLDLGQLRSYFGLHRGVPGYIKLSRSAKVLVFETFPGIRTITGQLMGPGSSKRHSEPSDQSSTGSGSSAKVLVHIAIDRIVGVKKTYGMNVGFQGLLVQVRDGEDIAFANVRHRDECFNEILSLSPGAWTRRND